jgi:lysozyme family protein
MQISRRLSIFVRAGRRKMAERNDFEKALKFTLKWEGGYVNNPADKGGATNKGITQRTYDAYRKDKKLPLRSVRSIINAEVEDIYFSRYWLPAQCDELPTPLSTSVFDTAVNYGVARALKFLQQAMGVKQDGRWGEPDRAALKQADARTLAVQICDLRIARRYARVKEDQTQKVFLKGWLNRDNALRKLVGGSTASKARLSHVVK